MQVQPVSFNASGIVGTAGFTANNVSPETGDPFDPDGTNGPLTSSTTVAQQPEQIVGFAFTGFSAVVIHNGSDATGDVVATASAPGTYSWSYELNAHKGLYVEATGTGKGTVWLV